MSKDSILDRFNKDAVIMFIGAHPDDETTISPLLAYAADTCREVFVVSLTRGESGWNLHTEDLTRTLAQVRTAELHAAAKIIGCTPVLFDYINGCSQAHPQGLAVLDLEDQARARRTAEGGVDASPEAVLERWTRQNGDPTVPLVRFFQEKRPDLVITLEPEKGFTGHREHIAMTRVLIKALEEYNRTAQHKTALYYAHNSSDNVPNAQRIMTESLNAAGGKDYRTIAVDSRACYESQYGTRGSETAARYRTPWLDQQLISFAGTL